MTLDTKYSFRDHQNPPQSVNHMKNSRSSTENIKYSRKYSKMGMFRRIISVGVVLQLLGNFGK